MTTPLRSKIVVATQDPFGYHYFTPTLKHYLRQLGHIAHLVPYFNNPDDETLKNIPETPEDYFYVSNNVNIIDKADLVIIVGGTMSFWTKAVGKRANERNVPVLFLEADYPAVHGTSRALGGVQIEKTIVSSPATSLIINSYFGFPEKDSAIVGLPLVDDLPEWKPSSTARKVMIATSVSADMPDNGKDLVDVAHQLQNEGWDVTVCLHPKEDRNIWADFAISSKTAVETASKSDVVVTYPSSVLIPLHVMRIPAVTLLYDERFLQIVPKSFVSLGEPSYSSNDTLELVEELSALDYQSVPRHETPVSEQIAKTIYPYTRKLVNH